MINQLETPLYERFAAKFEIAALQSSSDELRALRQEAFDTFKTLGFPSIKNEEWKYTNIVPLLKDDYELEASDRELSKEEAEKTAALIATHLEAVQNAIKGEQKGAYRLVVVNGRLNTALSVLPESSKANIISFAEAHKLPSFKQHFGKIAPLDQAPFTALNTALHTEGIFIEVPKGTALDKPLHLIHVYLNDGPALVQPRQLLVVNEQAEMHLIETVIHEQGQQALWVNAVTEISVAQAAQLHHYDIQTGTAGMRIIQRTESTQQKHSNYSNYTFTFPGTDFVRNNLALHLEDAELESHLYGLYLCSGKQLVDNHTEVHHKHPHGESNQLYKGVLLDQSKAVFNGKIFVYEDAQKTNAFQQSNNILFSDKATVNAKPQLEIFADDVKCSHGTTVGQINKEALFYLQSRGIGEQAAKNIMVNAFAYDVTQKVKIHPLRIYLEKLIAAEMEKLS